MERLFVHGTARVHLKPCVVDGVQGFRVASYQFLPDGQLSATRRVFVHDRDAAAARFSEFILAAGAAQG